LQGRLYIVSAPSGAGKTTLCNELTASMPSLAHSISHTTRKPRPGEVDGRHYYFVDAEKFRAMVEAGEFVEWATVHGNLYGTSKSELDRLLGQGKDVILDIDTQGAMQIRCSGTPGVFIFILPPSMAVLESRLRGRESDDEAEIRKRLARAVDEIRDYDKYDYMIVNDVFEDALDKLRAVIVSDKCRVGQTDRSWMKDRFGI
jgi:guanylate kinase